MTPRRQKITQCELHRVSWVNGGGCARCRCVPGEHERDGGGDAQQELVRPAALVRTPSRLVARRLSLPCRQELFDHHCARPRCQNYTTSPPNPSESSALPPSPAKLRQCRRAWLMTPFPRKCQAAAAAPRARGLGGCAPAPLAQQPPLGPLASSAIRARAPARCKIVRRACAPCSPDLLSLHRSSSRPSRARR